MVINFKNIPFYYLNYKGYPNRKIIMDNMLQTLGVSYTAITNDIELPLRQDRISVGHIKLLKHAIDANIFPFILMEDDVALINNLPISINIPSEANFIFLGGSTYNCGGIKPDMHIKDYDNNFYRSYYMLAPYPTIVPNLESAQLMLDFLNQSLQTSEFSDIVIAIHSEKYVYLTPKDGLYFYQNNYNEPVTNFLWKDNLNKYL